MAQKSILSLLKFEWELPRHRSEFYCLLQLVNSVKTMVTVLQYIMLSLLLSEKHAGCFFNYYKIVYNYYLEKTTKPIVSEGKYSLQWTTPKDYNRTTSRNDSQ